MTLILLAIIFVAILSFRYDGGQRSVPKETLKFGEMKEEYKAQGAQKAKEEAERQRLADVERRQNSRARALAAAQAFNGSFKSQPNTGIKT